MNKDAIFVSYWNNGVIQTPCKVNTDTREVFDISVVDFDGDILEKEYIILDGKEYPVFQYSDIVDEKNEFWYK